MRFGVAILAVILALAFARADAADEGLVTGTASYRERIALPPGAVFEAFLEDVTLADAPADQLGRCRSPIPGKPPFAFEIDFDPAKVDPSHIYAVRAQVSVGRKLIFVSDTMNPVLTQGAPDERGHLDDQGRRHHSGGQQQPDQHRRPRPAAAGELHRASCPARTARRCATG